MGLRGTLRTIQAEVRRAERASRGRQREAARLLDQQLRLLKISEAEWEASKFEQKCSNLRTLHVDVLDPIDWRATLARPQPEVPSPLRTHEREAGERMEAYRPTFFEKLLRADVDRRKELAEAFEQAKAKDREEHEDVLRAHRGQVEEWQHDRAIAELMLRQDPASWLEGIRRMNVFSEVNDLGTAFQLQIPEKATGLVEAEIHSHGEKVVPTQVKAVLKSGKLSVKEMPKTQYLTLFRDYVCSSALRIAGDLFAMLPVSTILVHVVDDMLNTATGHVETQAILSVAIPRRTLDALNLRSLDPSDSMSNFLRREDFSTRSGFRPVQRIQLAELPDELKQPAFRPPPTG